MSKEAKRLCLSCRFVPPRCTCTVDVEDCFNKLPDEILVTILSLLTLKEAAKTSILSRRWKSLWTFTTGSLDFDASKVFSKIFKSRQPTELLASERTKYINWVNHVLDSHKGESIDAFEMCFDLDMEFRSIVDSWIKLALQKKARRVKLNFRKWNHQCGNYPFPSHFLGDLDLKSLVSLNLNCVDVSGGVLENILSSCPLLEYFRLGCIKDLEIVIISGQFPRLKHLEIESFCNMKYIEISAENMTSFVYTGRETSLLFKNVPHLSMLSLAGGYCLSLGHKLPEISNVLSQIEMLKLRLLVIGNYPNLSGFGKLKQLELIIHACDKVSILPCINMIKGCSKLYRLVVQFLWGSPPATRKHLNYLTEPPECLKIVELRHFAGRVTDVELVEYLVSKCVSLEKIIVDTREAEVKLYSSRMGSVEIDSKQVAAECAKRLERELPTNAKWVIL